MPALQLEQQLLPPILLPHFRQIVPIAIRTLETVAQRHNLLRSRIPSPFAKITRARVLSGFDQEPPPPPVHHGQHDLQYVFYR